MRYILDSDGYIEEISFDNIIECNDNTCVEYTGSIPTGYTSLLDWSENAIIQAYKVEDGNLVFYQDKATELQALWNSQQLTYSTEEQVIGKWIDGKPLYRKVVDYGNLNSTQGVKSVEHGISNLKRIIRKDIEATNSTNTSIGIPHVATAYMFSSLSLSVRIDTKNINIYTSADASDFYVYAILIYTKTTD